VSREERFRAYEERKAEPVTVPEPAPEPVTVSYEVESAARALASRVRSGGRSCVVELRGLQPEAADSYVNYAVSQGWVLVDGDLLTVGPVDSRLPEQTGDVTLDGCRGWVRGVFGGR
jgi:hypothetical protein